MTKSIIPKSIVFYADDDPDDLSIVQETFRNFTKDVDFITATDGSGALSYFNNLTGDDTLPLLIILDINLPKVNGKQVLVKLQSQERFSQIPIVLFSTSSLSSDRLFARHYNAGYITKPSDINQMRFIAEQFIGYCTEEVCKKISRQMQ